ncbi:MAG: hypothetical protein A2X48_14260 [Lentisphaerae bacterium GWF2_49_21]|nr:MAG: hypothetical protein A2X48_14260 [Lentisphaerae bacterium GWF2_49_21]
MSQAVDNLSCSGCGKHYARIKNVWNLRTVLSDPATSWDAEVFDQAYEKSDGGFKDREMYASSFGIPQFADKYLESEKESRIKSFICERKPSYVLDLGCSSGWLSFEMSECSPSTVFYGIDISTYRVNLFQEQITARNCQQKMHAASANGENLPFRDDFFDIVVMDEVIEHLQEPGSTLREIKRVLKPDGYLIITTPSRFMTSFWKLAALVPTFLKRLFKGESLTRKKTIKPYENILPCSILKKLFEDAGFEIQKWDRVIFLPHESYLQHIPVPLLKIMLLKARLTGKIPFLKFLGLHHFILLGKPSKEIICI